MTENTLKIIIPSLFKAEIQYNLLIMKFKLMQNLLAKFLDKLKRVIKLRNFKVDRERVKNISFFALNKETSKPTILSPAIIILY